MAPMLQEDIHTLRKWLVVIGGILVLLPLGTTYSYGNIVVYIVSYIRYKGIDPHLTYQTVALIAAAMKVGHGLSMPAGGYLEKRFGVRVATFIGAAVFNLGVFASAWAVTVSFYFLIFTYGILFGVGCGLAYTPPLICVMKWMPNHKGMVSGLTVAGYGAGSLVFNLVQTLFINPDNLKPDIRDNGQGAEQWFYSQNEVLDRVPFSFIQQGIIFSIMHVIGIVLLGDPPTIIKRSRRYAIRRKQKPITEKSGILMNERPLSSSDNDRDDGGSATAEGATGDLHHEQSSTGESANAGIEAGTAIAEETDGDKSHLENGASTSTSRSPGESLGDLDRRWSGKTLAPLEMLKDWSFWHLASSFTMNSFVILYITSLYKAYGQTFIPDDLFLAVAGSCASVSNAVGRVFWGHIADRFSFKVSFITLSAVMSVFTFTFGLSFYGSKIMFTIWLVVIFFSIGGVFSTAPTATSRAFGSEHLGVNYGILFLLGSSISSIVAAVTQQPILHFMSWNVIFILTGGFSTLGMIIAMFFNVKTPDGVDI
ncbi:uncharacterized protein LOC121430055 isoform X2 [Lytechinus variegatus]|uniref:uncharacterized protein LOC121430055 isoform X2 n=1 Tax=Lytechinus variegatus TaxID=7654 RepID=UPI001BB22FDC|nr:uncharacterized protein LOC121430055 isoform X2 [Lytechinus variegatus]